jgi:peroxiredoxin
MMEDENTPASDGGNVMSDENETMMESGSYESYAPEKLARANEGDVVLFFRADWCPTCRAADADIRANLSDIPAGLTILDVDYDTATALKQKYIVTYQHTFVLVDAAGNQLAKWSGGGGGGAQGPKKKIADIAKNVK